MAVRTEVLQTDMEFLIKHAEDVRYRLESNLFPEVALLVNQAKEKFLEAERLLHQTKEKN